MIEIYYYPHETSSTKYQGISSSNLIDVKQCDICMCKRVEFE
jgi:hypothetical protein